MESSNPVLGRGLERSRSEYLGHERMTVGGTVNKTGFLLVIAGAVAAYPWSLLRAGEGAMLGSYSMAAFVGSLVLCLAIVFRPHWAFWAAPLYAACEGMLLGAISAMFNAQYPGIAFQALAGTLGTLFFMLLIYRTRIIQVTDKFRLGLVCATGGVAVIYLLSMVLGFFGIAVPLINDSGMFGIIFSLVVVGVAALNLVLDFDLIERGSKAGAPKYMEWYGAFALMVTLVWLYLEMLRLFSKLRRD